MGDLILPLVSSLAQRLSHARAREVPAAVHALCMGVGLLSKSLLQHLTAMASEAEFPELWSRALLAFQVLRSHLPCVPCWGGV